MGESRATIFVNHPGDGPPPELLLVLEWFKRWEGKVRVADYSSGGWEHLWDVEGPTEAIDELPVELLCGSKWAGIRGRTGK